MSIDHNTTLPGEAERIRRAGGTIYEGRVNDTLNLTRALGDFEFKNHPRLSPQEQMIQTDPEVPSCLLTMMTS
jgi:protein phosphatase 1G